MYNVMFKFAIFSKNENLNKKKIECLDTLLLFHCHLYINIHVYLKL